jgi:1,5-anhydro-D-fructose reductase (1,5-anhydro-D-mannitol-forming)
MRWGIVGTGMHASQRIAPALAASATERLHGVAGSSEAKAREFAQRLGAGQAYPSLEAMLGDRAIEAVFIATPNDRHRRQVELAAAAGKHVLVEKPMALDEADCRAMIAACARAKVKLGLGFHLRHHPVHREIRRLIDAGELGEVVLVRGEWHTAYGPWQNWRADVRRAGSDVTGAVAVHVLDLMGWFAGAEVRDVAALVDRSKETGLDQTIACALGYANGVMGTASATRRAAWPLNSVQVWGTRGAAGGIGTVGANLPGKLRRTSGAGVEERVLPMVDLFAAQFEAFARAVQRDEEPDASGADGLRSTALASRILAAAA